MTKIYVKAGGPDRLVPMPGGKVIRHGDAPVQVEMDQLVYRLLEHGDLERVDDPVPPARTTLAVKKED